MKWVEVGDWWELREDHVGLVAWTYPDGRWSVGVSRTTHTAFQTGRSTTVDAAKAAVEALAWARAAERLGGA